MAIMNTIFFSAAYSFVTYHVAKMLGYNGESLLVLTFIGLVLGTIRGLED